MIFTRQSLKGLRISEERLGIRKKTGRDKVLFSFQRSQIANGQAANAGSSALPTLRRQIFYHLPTSSSIEKQTDSDIFLLSCTSSYLPHISHIFYTSCISAPS